MDNHIDSFRAETNKILDDYIDDTTSYSDARYHMKNAGERLVYNLQNRIPYPIIEELFNTFSELEIQAYKQSDSTMEHAISSIESIAKHIFGPIKTPDEITQVIMPYKRQIGAPATFEDISLDPLCGALSPN
ncbi:MAG: hypothetical protein COB36_08190 [Alphaproteobacteria bacterium]|nr:MAG: hypothetical protein COB36_08190 [Alphaproteobacteria bacterium]